MSVFPLFNACFIGCLLVGAFFWKMYLLMIFFLAVLVSSYIFVLDALKSFFHYEAAFWLFIFTEVIVFGMLIVRCLYFDHRKYINLSDSLEIPFLGCFLLLGSRITMTGFHHLLGWKYSWVLLVFTIILGLSFVGLQIFEFKEIFINIYDTRFHASRFCTVGTHFIHVLLGVFGMIIMLLSGIDRFGVYRCTVLTWYWHFVDYVWLFVYTFVYVC